MSQGSNSAPERDFTADAIALAERAAGLGVWEWRVATGNLRWTPGLEPLHGLTPGQFEGTFEHFIGLIYADDRPRVMDDIQAALGSGPPEFETEFRVLYPDGSIHWVLGKGMVFRDATGAPERMVGIGLDVTDRHRREVADEILVRSGGILSASLDYEETIEAVIAVLIPDLADH